MAANANFKLSITLIEANIVRNALEERLARLQKRSITDLDDEEREEIGRIDKMLRIDF